MTTIQYSLAEADEEFDTVLAALHDDDCRAILLAAETPSTAAELSERCDIPLSTTYRKVNHLSELGLLEEGMRLTTNGKHPCQYTCDFDRLVVKRRPITVERRQSRPAGPFIR